MHFRQGFVRCGFARIAASSLLSAAIACGGHASLTMTSGGTYSRPQNLLTNGSFEIGAPTTFGNKYYWATGTTLTNFPFAVPAGWSSAGTASTYATWGRDGFANSTQLSDLLPDGNNGMYFGNSDTYIDQVPSFNADGTVSFAAAPNFSPKYGGPCRLWQTIPTVANPAASYKLSFWVSGEAAAFGSFVNPSVFGLKMTNVLAGDPIQYLTVPNGVGPMGASKLYEFTFTPLNPFANVDIEFINWGHYDNGNFAQLGTELVLDDVIVNTGPVPSPGTIGVLAMVGLAGRRRR